MTNVEQTVHAIDDIEIEHEYVSDAALCLLQTILFQRALKNPLHSEREARKLSIRYPVVESELITQKIEQGIVEYEQQVKEAMESIIKSDQQPKVSSHRIELTLLEQQTGTFFSSKEKEVEKWIITFRVQPTNEDTPNDIRNKKQQAASSNVERGIRQILQRAHAKVDHLSTFDACTFDGCFPFKINCPDTLKKGWFRLF